MNFKTIEWKKDRLILIDQRKLPTEETYVECTDYKQVADAIRDMVVRGAPAIGVTAAFGVAIAAQGIAGKNYNDFMRKIESACQTLLETRPTAVNLAWALERMKKVCLRSEGAALPEIIKKLEEEAILIYNEDIETNKKMGRYGADLVENGMTILTHCNAGALATAGYGTALGVFYAAQEQGKKFEVFAPETRPFLQGARLTAWELVKNKISVTLITDNMIGSFMRQKKFNLVVVGADRIAANGDVANKIGTYTSAFLAKGHGVPFYVAAPLSTIDKKTPTGNEIPIEERSPAEVANFHRQLVAPEGVKIRNPAFDVTPHELVSGIITEKGILREPYAKSIQNLA
ncbi:MAG: S-methyl-5-thioribose-1-phosphate isomerase [Deltaproteobacteria bacterium]|nr:S-methyl-5-thioribose-1-phosphate isomerase [Deltaproteobacteria bacterium]